MSYLVTFLRSLIKSFSNSKPSTFVFLIAALAMGSLGEAGEPTPKEKAVREFLHKDPAASAYLYKNNFLVDSVILYDLPYGAFLQAALGTSQQDQQLQMTLINKTTGERFLHQCYLFTRSVERSADGNPQLDKYEGFYLSNCMREAKDLNTLYKN